MKQLLIFFIVICSLQVTKANIAINNDSIINDTTISVISQSNIATLSSKTEIDIPAFVPPSPNASSLGIFGAIPVGHYTGTANISIPLYEINLDGKKFPIELSYHSSGIKVAQEASHVGLGWALQFGGSIVKNMRGIDDFKIHVGYYFDTSMPLADADNEPDISQATPSQLALKYSYYYSGARDAELDQFFFNVANHSGSLFFNKVNTGNNTQTKAYPTVQKISEYLHIEYDITSERWIIIDGDGYKYYFGSKEQTIPFRSLTYSANLHPSLMGRNAIYYSDQHPNAEKTTAWYIDSIISPRNEKMLFEYKKERVYSLIQVSENVSRDAGSTWSSHASLEDIPGDFESCVYSYSISDQLVINSIKTNKETVYFYTSDRDDIELVEGSGIDGKTKAQKISEIKILNNNNRTVSRYQLQYSYFGDREGYEYKRLRLDNIISYKHSNKKYEFVYNVIQLPSKYSNQIDDWGYYNGAAATSNCWGRNFVNGVNLQTKIPEYKYRLPYPYNNEVRIAKGRKRTVSDKYSQAGMLKSIQYPTGGKTLFTYKPHDLSALDEETIETKYVTLAKVNHLNFIMEEEDYEYPGDVLVANFSLAETLRGAVITTLINITEWAEYEGTDPSSFGPCITLYRNGSLIKTLYLLRENYNKLVYYELSEPLTAGNYELRLNVHQINSPHKLEVAALVEYNENLTTITKGKGGGLRVEEICNMDNEEVILKTKYEYSTGTIMNKPIYVYREELDMTTLRQVGNGAISIDYGFVYLNGKSAPVHPLSTSALGNCVGYSWVNEVKVSNRDNINDGYIKYSFHNYPDSYPWLTLQEGIIYNGLPGIPDLRNGLKKEIAIYNAEGNLKQKTNYYYKEKTELQSTIKGVVLRL